ncbi:MAG TPA: hypothetical protein DC017_02420 [Candidatus Wallbacteria bacterium]|nr:hypothetical protein [Candidatus Wallbacteria bacterium]
MKKIYYLIIIAAIFFDCSIVHADSVESYRKFCTLTGLYDTEEGEISSHLYGHLAVDYAVEILKENPNSIEACEIVELVTRTLNDDKTKDFYNKLKEKHMPNFDDPDFEPAEKIIFLSMLRCGIEAKNLEENKQYQLLANKGFINMKDNCMNSDYAALATKGLFKNKSNEERLMYKKYFLEKYPQHKHIPHIKQSIINELYCENNPQKCIEELLKLAEQYKNLSTPHGWRIVMDYYCDIAYTYRDLKDFENAKKYYYMIEKEVPNYWNLKYLKPRLFPESND